MFRFASITAILLLALTQSYAFTSPIVRLPTRCCVSYTAATATTTTTLRATTDTDEPLTIMQRSVERGVSVDQDGKSNVWAIEPKMEVSSKSNEEKTQSYLIAGGGLAAAAVAAGVILSNLPDPSQF